MKILDIDLDFFLSDIATSVSEIRLEASQYIAWDEEKVRLFIESQCGLSKSTPVKGCLFKHHDEVFKFWRKLIRKHILKTPFEVVHVDAHADLGFSMFDGSWKYIMGNLLFLPVESRDTPIEGDCYGLTANNYLYFALACQWINKLTYVHHPKMKKHFRHDDLPPAIFKDFDVESGIIQLKKYDKNILDDERFFDSPLKYPCRGLENEIQFNLVECKNYKADSDFSFVFLTQSPGYTPVTSDKLIPIIKEYIDVNII